MLSVIMTEEVKAQVNADKEILSVVSSLSWLTDARHLTPLRLYGVQNNNDGVILHIWHNNGRVTIIVKPNNDIEWDWVDECSPEFCTWIFRYICGMIYIGYNSTEL